MKTMRSLLTLATLFSYALICNGQDDHLEENHEDDNSLPDSYIQITGSLILVPASSMDDPVYVLPPEEDGDGDSDTQESRLDQIGEEQSNVGNAVLIYPESQTVPISVPITNGQQQVPRLPLSWNNQQIMQSPPLQAVFPGLPPITRQPPQLQINPGLLPNYWWDPRITGIPQNPPITQTTPQPPTSTNPPCNNPPPPPPCVCPNQLNSFGYSPIQPFFPSLGYNQPPPAIVDPLGPLGINGFGEPTPVAVFLPDQKNGKMSGNDNQVGGYRNYFNLSTTAAPTVENNTNQ